MAVNNDQSAKKLERILYNKSNGDVDAYHQHLLQLSTVCEGPWLEDFKEADSSMSLWKTISSTENSEGKGMYPTEEDFASDEEEDQVDEEHGYMTCSCGSKRIKWKAFHTRSADEGATLFCRCKDCGNKWRISS